MGTQARTGCRLLLAEWGLLAGLLLLAGCLSANSVTYHYPISALFLAQTVPSPPTLPTPRASIRSLQ